MNLEKEFIKITKARNSKSTVENFMKSRETFHFIYDQIDRYANSIAPFLPVAHSFRIFYFSIYLFFMLWAIVWNIKATFNNIHDRALFICSCVVFVVVKLSLLSITKVYFRPTLFTSRLALDMISLRLMIYKQNLLSFLMT